MNSHQQRLPEGVRAVALLFGALFMGAAGATAGTSVAKIVSDPFWTWFIGVDGALKTFFMDLTIVGGIAGGAAIGLSVYMIALSYAGSSNDSKGGVDD